MGDYTDLATLKSWLKVSDTADDTLYSLAISVASRSIDETCNRRFDADTSASARTFIAPHPNVLVVPDISTTTGLVVATDNDADGVYELTWTLGADYQLDPPMYPNRPYTKLRGLSRYFPMYVYQRAGVQVTAKWGWPGGTPEPIQQAALILAARIVKRKDSPTGVLGFGDMGNVVRVTSVDRDVQSLIAPYKRMRTT